MNSKSQTHNRSFRNSAPRQSLWNMIATRICSGFSLFVLLILLVFGVCPTQKHVTSRRQTGQCGSARYDRAFKIWLLFWSAVVCSFLVFRISLFAGRPRVHNSCKRQASFKSKHNSKDKEHKTKSASLTRKHCESYCKGQTINRPDYRIVPQCSAGVGICLSFEACVVCVLKLACLL